ncbi:hypothetical protein ABZY93_22015 [Streptomyces smyrnaeus]|uniref:hypothetical protein n=1 Tax=Streptomyces smyrnaeus TaxID=1387713 RepID=UPI0033B47CFF
MTLTLMELPNDKHPNSAVPRDGHGRPLVIPPCGGRPTALTRTTTFIDCIEDKSNLATWKQRETLRGAAMQPGLLDAVADLDPSSPADKRKLTALAERAADVAGANRASSQGTRLHTLSEYVDRGDPLPSGITSEELADMAAYMVETCELRMLSVEQFVVVPELAVGGTFDRTAELTGRPCPSAGCPGRHIVDLKTGSMEYGTVKMPAQLAIYSRGQKYDHTMFPAPNRAEDEKAWEKWKRTEVPAAEAAMAYTPLADICQDWGIVIHLPQGKATCTLHWADLRKGWELALFAKDVRARRKTRDTLIPFGVDSVAPGV